MAESTLQQGSTQRTSRLHEAEDRPRFAPWTRAWNLDACQLYWLPVSSFPIGQLQRRWLLAFTERLLQQLGTAHDLLPQVFLKMSVVMPNYRDAFVNNAASYKPLFGLGRHPGRALPPLPDENYAKDLQKGRITYDPDAVRPDYAYWLSGGDRNEQLQLFLGSAGTTTLLLPPPPKAPEVRSFRLEAIHDPAMRQLAQSVDFKGKMQDLHAIDAPFFQQSKEMFAADLKEDPQYRGLLFALPLLGAEDFFAATPDSLQQWFDLMPVYLRESPEDRGVMLATAKDIEADLEAVLKGMEEEGQRYLG